MSTWTDVTNYIKTQLKPGVLGHTDVQKILNSILAVINQINTADFTPTPESLWKADVTYPANTTPVLWQDKWLVSNTANNLGNVPINTSGVVHPTWRVISASAGSGIAEWESKVYPNTLEIVFVDGALYYLDREEVGAAPYVSVDFAEELLDGVWASLGGMVPHNSLQGLNQGNYQHLTASELATVQGITRSLDAMGALIRYNFPSKVSGSAGEAASDFVTVAQVEAALNAKIGGTIAAGQVAFGTAAGVIGGSSRMLFNSATGLLTLDGILSIGRSQTIINNTSPNPLIYGTDGFIDGSLGEGGGDLVLSSRPQLPRSILLVTHNGTNTNTRWRISSSGIFESNGSQTIQTSTGALTLQSGGRNVLINTTINAGFRLDVNGTARIVGATRIDNLAGTGTRMVVADANGVMSTQALGIAGSGTLNRLAKFTAAGTVGDSQVFDNGTNVGIGTTTLSEKVNIDGNVLLRSAGGIKFNRLDNAIFTHLYDAGTFFALDNRNGNGFDFQSAGTSQMRITSGGDIEIKKSDSRIRGGDASGRVILSNSDTSAYLTINGSSNGNSIALVTNQHIVFNSGASYSERMRITSGGNLLINTTTDAGFRLDVNGTGRFSGALQISNNANSGVVGTNFQAFAVSSNSFFRLGNNTSNSLDIQLTRSDSATMFSVNGHTGASTFFGAATFANSVTATAFFTTSDKRKKDIISQDGELAIYRFKGDKQIHYGYIAQDMQALYPNQVSKGTDGMLSLNYIEILVKKVHDLESKLKRHGLD
jgi:hypothetical protein